MSNNACLGRSKRARSISLRSGLPLAARAVFVWLVLALPPILASQITTSSIPPSNFEEIVRQADDARERNEVASATTLYEQALGTKPDWAEGWWKLGMLRYGAGSYAESRDALNRFIALSPDAGPGYSVRGLCEFQTGEYAQSLQDLRRGLALGGITSDRNEQILRYHEAQLLTLDGDFEDALQEYRFFARQKIRNDEILMGLGLAGLRIPVLPKDLKADWHDLALAAGAAAFDAIAEDNDSANREFATLFQRYPKTASAHYLWGYLLFANDPDRAEAEFKRELDVNPQSVPSHVMLAWGELLRNEPSAALEDAKKAVAEDSTSPTALLVLGRALVETGDVKGGTQHLEEALKLSPDNLEIHFALARAYSKSGRKSEATRERELCLALTRNEAPSAHP